MWSQFFLVNSHYAINLLTALVMFAVGWLYLDAYKVDKSFPSRFKLFGFLLLTFSFLISATYVESELIPSPLFSKTLFANLIVFTKFLGLIFVLIGVVKDPLEPKPHISSKTSANYLFLPLIGSIPFLYLNFSIPFLVALVGFFYLRRATIGLENHLKPVSISFFILALSELTALSGLFHNTKNPDLYLLVAPFGGIWVFGHLLLLIASLILLKWVFSYLFKSLDTEIFFIYVCSIVTIFLITGITYSFLLVKNIETDAIAKIKTEVAVLNLFIEGKKDALLSDSQSLALNPQIKDNLSDVSKLSLKSIVESYLHSKKLDTLILVNKFGQVIIRAEDNERFGDSLSSEPLVKKSLLGDTAVGAAKKESVLTSNILLRAASPIQNETEVLGAVVTGNIIDNAFVDGIKTSTGLDSNIYADNLISATTLTNAIDHKRLLGIKQSNPEIKNILSGKLESFTGIVNIGGIDFLASFLPIYDSDGNSVGLLSAQKPHAEVLKTAGKSLEVTFIFSILLIILSIIPTRLISKFIISQIN